MINPYPAPVSTTFIRAINNAALDVPSVGITVLAHPLNLAPPSAPARSWRARSLGSRALRSVFLVSLELGGKKKNVGVGFGGLGYRAWIWVLICTGVRVWWVLIGANIFARWGRMDEETNELPGGDV